jgi:hypothetical protein
LRSQAGDAVAEHPAVAAAGIRRAGEQSAEAAAAMGQSGAALESVAQRSSTRWRAGRPGGGAVGI